MERGAGGQSRGQKGNPQSLLDQRRRLKTKRHACDDRRKSFWPRLFKKKRFALSLGLPGAACLWKGCVGAWRSRCAQPSRAATRVLPASSNLQPPASPSSPPGRARFCPQFHSRETDYTLVGATSCRGTGHTRETRGVYCGFLRFLSSWRGERAGAFPLPSQHEWITYLPTWPAPGGFPRRRTRRPPRAQPRCSRPGARGTPGLVVLRGPAGRGGGRGARAGATRKGEGQEVKGWKGLRKSPCECEGGHFKNLKPPGSRGEHTPRKIFKLGVFRRIPGFT